MQHATDVAVRRDQKTSITIYDPVKGLEERSLAKTAYGHWERAKDADKMIEAVKVKIWAEVDYVVWRDDGANPRGQPKKNSFRSERILPEGDPGDVTIHRWRKRFCRKENGRTQPDQEKIDKAIDVATVRCIRICEQLNTERGTGGTGEYLRYTPSEYVEAVRKVLGRIDLDPASDKQAQETVKAKKYFTEEDDGLKQEWHGNVFLNPPYHRKLIPQFIDKLIAELEAGHTKSAILLTNNSTDTEWFDKAIGACASICFDQTRIQFHHPSEDDVNPTQGQAFCYFGPDVKRFEEVFCTVGNCVRPSRQYQPQQSQAAKQ
jgi:phage N-6-adenine-methyltransferase